MDKFGVPKKVNRHVLKAVYFMNHKGLNNSKHSDIMRVVRTTMKSNVPNDLSLVVQKSLKNMAKLGVIRKWGTTFSVHKKNPKTVSLRNINRGGICQRLVPVPTKNEYNEENKSKLDPNLKRRRFSESSSSDSDVEKSRKRFRTTRPFSWKGRAVFLPKARMSPKSPDKTMESCVINFKKKKVIPKKITKCDLDPNTRKRGHSDSSTSACATKRKRFRLSAPPLRKRHRIISKPRVIQTLNLCQQNGMTGMKTLFKNNSEFKRTKNNPVAKNIEPLYDDDDNDETINLFNGMWLNVNPELTQHDETTSDVSMNDRITEVTAEEEKTTWANPTTTNIKPSYDDFEDIGKIEAQNETSQENTEQPQDKAASDVSLVDESKSATPEEQVETTSECSVRKVYESNHFSKDSNIEIETIQEKNESEKVPIVANVPMPSGEQTASVIKKANGKLKKSISPKIIIKVDGIVKKKSKKL